MISKPDKGAAFRILLYAAPRRTRIERDQKFTSTETWRH